VAVTGGAAGIGAASARAFAARGATVVVLDRDEATAAELVSELTGAGQAAEARPLDVSDAAAVATTFAGLLSDHGRLDVLHANAGVEWTKTVADTEPGEWQHVVGINLTGVFSTARQALRAMVPRRSGAIVVTASPHATRTVPDAGAYAASKGGALALMKAMALEAASSGVRVNAVVPGAIDTPMLRREAQAARDPEDQLRRFAGMHPMNRLGRPEEVAAAVMFLASDEASFVTGATLCVDGGMDAALPTSPPLPYSGA
jgi:NAD(P)-dependent dehydrogenase (short-subunit alcohol dehydrogenase family)